MESKCGYRFDHTTVRIAGKETMHSGNVPINLTEDWDLYKQREFVVVTVRFQIDCTKCTLKDLFDQMGRGESNTTTAGLRLAKRFIDTNCPKKNPDSQFKAK
jgi:hypothetical protein